MPGAGTGGNHLATLWVERASNFSKKNYLQARKAIIAFHLLASDTTTTGFAMDGTLQIIAAALTTGSMLGPGGTSIASNPNSLAMTMVLLLAALMLAALAAWRAATGPVRRPPPPGPALPRLRRRMQGPRERRA
jgi:hypothetical protein